MHTLSCHNCSIAFYGKLSPSEVTDHIKVSLRKESHQYRFPIKH